MSAPDFNTQTSAENKPDHMYRSGVGIMLVNSKKEIL